MSNRPIRIILVDDHQVSRESWTTLLGYEERFIVLHACDNGQEAIELARQLKPDIMIVDVNMYPVNGFEVTRKVLMDNPSIRIIGISINNHPSYANRMLESGARGFITKGTAFEEILKGILEVYGGGKCIKI